MKKTLFVIIASILLIGGVGAAAVLLFPYNPLNPPKAQDSGWNAEGLQEVANANNMFAIKLYKSIENSSKGNIFYSPYSMFSALCMLYEGARGNTQEEMKNVMELPDKSVLRANFAHIYDVLNNNKGYTLRTGNALWVEKTFHILDSYKNDVSKYYGGKAVELDFMNHPEESRENINEFIEEQTNGKIKDLLPPHSITTGTKLVITNAVYFNGSWLYPFDASSTQEDDFYISENKIVEAKMMTLDTKHKEFNYFENKEIQAIELPYKGNKVSMYIFLPKTPNYNISWLENNITYESIKEWEKRMEPIEIDEIEIPKFKLEETYNMKEILRRVGLVNTLSPSPDLSGIDGRNDLIIDKVIHKSYINVDEQGTEAAAATGIPIITSARIGGKPIKFIANHPFLFLIQDKRTGTILFMGKVVNPNES